jgi:hypothetical protein
LFKRQRVEAGTMLRRAVASKNAHISYQQGVGKFADETRHAAFIPLISS